VSNFLDTITCIIGHKNTKLLRNKIKAFHGHNGPLRNLTGLRLRKI
jgi:hypothetical protein